MAEYIAVPYKLLHRLPDELGYDTGALIEPLSNALHFVKDCTPVKLGDHVVVQGCGPIGLFSAQLFRLAGAEVIVTGVNVDTERFKIAEGLGLRDGERGEGGPRQARAGEDGWAWGATRPSSPPVRRPLSPRQPR